MSKFPEPIIGLAFGICLILFRKKIAVFLEKTVAKIPYYKMGGVHINFKVRPIYIAAFGALYSLVCLYGLILWIGINFT
jgi:hypothetical protein